MSETPFYMQGNFLPIETEATFENLEVMGEIPAALSGHFLRNGPNPTKGDPGHWFFGDGMLHAIRLENGRAASYRNRFIKTPSYLGKEIEMVDSDGQMNRYATTANTHIVEHAGKLLALAESAFPVEVTRDLDTVGPVDFDGVLKTSFTAHPKFCSKTGEMLAFGYSFLPPFLTYHRVDAQGKMVQSEAIEVPGSTMMHDFAITENHVIFMDLPLVFKIEEAMAGNMPYVWEDSYGARLGIMPRNGGNADVKWVEIEPCYVVHTLNAFEQDGKIMLDAVRYSEFPDVSFNSSPGLMTRWTIDLSNNKVTEETLDDRNCDFPRLDPRLEGQHNRFGYSTEFADGPGLDMKQLIKYDLDARKTETHDFGNGVSPGEGVFAATAPDSGEDEGFILVMTHDEGRQQSELQILDAQNFAGDAVGRIQIPQRVPVGFHGNWAPDVK
jgi:carotenoid cleavage dioxygenase-like enzyme